MITKNEEQILKRQVTLLLKNRELSIGDHVIVGVNGHILIYSPVRVSGYTLSVSNVYVSFGCQHLTEEDLLRAIELLKVGKQVEVQGLIHRSSPSYNVEGTVSEESPSWYIIGDRTYAKADYTIGTYIPKTREFVIERDKFFYNGYTVGSVEASKELLQYALELLQTYKTLYANGI